MLAPQPAIGKSKEDCHDAMYMRCEIFLSDWENQRNVITVAGETFEELCRSSKEIWKLS